MEAERLGREAVASFDGTDFIDQEADAHWDLADVLRLAGRDPEAAEELRAALELYERKGHLVGAEKSRRGPGRAWRGRLGDEDQPSRNRPAASRSWAAAASANGMRSTRQCRLWRRAN